MTEPESAKVMTVRVVAVVSGHVQGVGYRWFVRELANAAGLSGSATNLPDGRVEVVVEGPEDDVDTLVDALGGPRVPGTVTRVDRRSEPVQGSSGFTTA
jgi:acylphosphatase